MPFNVDKIIDQIQSVNRNNPTLTEVNILGRGVGDAGCVKIAEALRGNTTVTILRLSDCSIGDAGASALAKMLTVNSTLTDLRLGGNNVGRVGATALAKALSTANSTLTHLSLIRNSVGDAGATALAGTLTTNSTLTSVDLYDNNIGTVGATALAEAMGVNSTVTFLDLQFNNVGDAGATALAGMLAVNSALIELCLHHSSIGDAGALALADSLETSNSTLTNLGLDTNYIGDVGASALLEAAYAKSSLIFVSLWRNNLSADLAGKIKDMVRTNAKADPPEARRLKIELKVGWMLDSEGGAEHEAAVNLALDELGSFPEAVRRGELFRRLLGSPERGADVAKSVDAGRGRTLYLYAAECGAAPGVLMNILQAHPSLCGTCRDVKHKLYPFMLLATMSEAGADDVMSVLLQNPAMVKSGISGSRDDGERSDLKK